jgi:hypothetical protein
MAAGAMLPKISKEIICKKNKKNKQSKNKKERGDAAENRPTTCICKKTNAKINNNK